MNSLNRNTLSRGASLAACSLLALVSTAFGPAAQVVEAGYTSQVTALPNGAGAVLPLQDGRVVYFVDGTRLVLDDLGGNTRDLLTLPNSVFASFTVDAGRGRIVFGESSNGDLWLVSLRAGGPAPRILANLNFNYDAVLWENDQLLVSAKTGGFSTPDNDVFAVDLQTGATDRIALLPGASGPLARDRFGVYYATSSASFPAPPGSTDLLFFSNRTLRGGLGMGELGVADARSIATGLDAAGSLAIDTDGDLLLTDFINSVVVEVSRGRDTVQRRSNLVDWSAGGPGVGGLSFRFRNGPGAFEPFQPRSGAVLVAHESSFSTGVSQLRTIEPVRPTLEADPASPIGAGSFDLNLRGAPAGGLALIAFGPNPFASEVPVPVTGFEQQIFWDRSFFRAYESVAVNLDAQGNATLTLNNPGLGQRVRFGAQAAFVDAAGVVVGSSGALELVLD